MEEINIVQPCSVDVTRGGILIFQVNEKYSNLTKEAFDMWDKKIESWKKENNLINPVLLLPPYISLHAVLNEAFN
jgi:hypothetical protein